MIRSKYYLSICFCCLMVISTQGIFAQVSNKMDVQLSNGFESNAFNALRFRIAEQDSANLQRGGYYFGMNVQNKLKFKLSKHKIYVYGILNFQKFYDLNNADLIIPRFKIKHYWSINKRSKIQTGALLKFYRTNRGEDDTQGWLVPRSYARKQFYLKYSILTKKSNRYGFLIRHTNQVYQNINQRALSYNSIEMEFDQTLKLGKSRKSKNSLITKVAIARRLYRDIRQSESKLVSDEQRIWDYFEISSELKLHASKVQIFQIGMEYNIREDRLQNEFGFSEIGVYLKNSFTWKKAIINIKSSYNDRRYHTMLSDSVSSDLLRHQYIRTSANLELILKKSFSIKLETSYINRMRNNSEIATRFLAYDNLVSNFGLKFSL